MQALSMPRIWLCNVREREIDGFRSQILAPLRLPRGSRGAKVKLPLALVFRLQGPAIFRPAMAGKR